MNRASEIGRSVVVALLVLAVLVLAIRWSERAQAWEAYVAEHGCRPVAVEARESTDGRVPDGKGGTTVADSLPDDMYVCDSNTLVRRGDVP